MRPEKLVPEWPGTYPEWGFVSIGAAGMDCLIAMLRSTWRVRFGEIPFESMDIDVPHIITCVDCGGVCHRLTREPDDGFAPGAIVAFRCEDCLDRWDLVFDPEEAQP